MQAGRVVVLKGKRIAGLALVLLVAGMAVLIGVVKMNTQKYAVEGAFCVGYDYELKTYGDCAYWANDENLFRGNLKNTQSVKKIMDYMEQDTDSEIRVTAGTDRYIFYIRCYEDRYYEFHVYDKKIGRDDKIYSSVSYARRNHSYLGINEKGKIEGVQKEQEDFEKLPVKFWMYGNTVYYQEGTTIYKNKPNSLFCRKVLTGVDEDSSIFVNSDGILYVSEDKKTYSFSLSDQKSVEIFDGMYQTLHSSDGSAYLQKMDGTIWKWRGGKKLDYYDKADGYVYYLGKDRIVYTDRAEENFVLRDGKNRQDKKVIPKTDGDMGVTFSGDKLYIASFDEEKKQPGLRVVKP